MEFDYKFYLDTYPDLRHFDEYKALNHWQNYGLKEGRRCCKNMKTNYETNVTIMIHLFQEDLFAEFLTYINNVKEVFNIVNVIITININSTIDKMIQQDFPNFIIIKVENKGVDCYPFMESVKYIRKNNIKTDYILKLHTKTSNLNHHDFNNWRQELIKPITNINNLFMISHYLKKIKNIGYVAAQRCVMTKLFDKDFPGNIKGLNLLCDKFPHLEQNMTDFIAGTMFWMSNEVLNQYLTDELMDYIIPQFVYQKPEPDMNNNKIVIEYVCERLFTGIFCYDKTNILVNEFKCKYSGFGTTNKVIDHSYFYQPNVFSFHIPKNVILS